MNIDRTVGAFRRDVSLQSVVIVLGLLATVIISEALLFSGYLRYSIWLYASLLLALSLAPLLFEGQTPVFQAFVLLPAFRLLNLAMPVFIELTLFWLPLVYGPLILAVLYLGQWGRVDGTKDPEEPPKQATVGIRHDLPWWLGGNRGGKLRRLFRRVWRSLAPPEEASTARLILHTTARVLFLVLVPVAIAAFLLTMGVLIVYLAEFEYGIITPTPLIPSLNAYQVGVLAVMMVVFVGFAEELLFRGILQKVLERRLGLVPGILLASGIFGVMHSGYGIRMEIVFAAGTGLLFGIIYDATDSLALVSVMHGLSNVLVFGVIPLDGGSSIDLLRATATQTLQRYEVWWLVDEVLDLLLAGLL